MKSYGQNNEDDEGGSAVVLAEVNELWVTVGSLVKYGNFVVKVAMLLYLVLVICVMLKWFVWWLLYLVRRWLS